MDKFVALQLDRDEYAMLVRLLGHHVSGDKIQPVYERLYNLRRMEATIAENKGPLCSAPYPDCADLYGKRPIVKIGD